ncbi:unnamed protein product [Owenia fusiformis]|uniref:chitin synthase n=1 Tax=Owenia fusiformis TaxID=6347 RepID=A0A8S4PNT4_OWEFU|nr:unnamed protein product [Owenia fusiformis]
MESGPLVWYQKFEYAVGHWFQKSTEHVIGCVLCSPGCFSLFRGSALMDDNVARRYTKVATEPMHYVQYDQGEDRWLCTLLLQQGYRVEYSAAADALTYAPEGFSEFFNQRRRWTPSTLANILDLLMSAKQTTKMNDNISWLYMAYQGALFGSSILGPGTVFLVIVGALQNLITAPGQPPDNIISISINAALVVGFTMVCLTLKSETQLYIAAIISTIYSVVMMLVMVSTFAAIRDKGLCDVSTLFMIVLISIFVIAGLMHPHEFGCLLYALIYYMVVPSTFVLLMIYSLCNLNNVSWGTREVKKTQFEEEKERLIQEQQTNVPGGLNGTLGAIFARAQQYAGVTKEGITCCGIRCLFDANQQERQMEMRMRAAAELEAKRDIGGDNVEQINHGANGERKLKVNHLGNIVSDDTSIQDDIDSIDSIASVNKPKTWIEDQDLGDGMIIELNAQDKVFWEEMIEAYLKPIDIKPEDKERIELQLKELRNKVVFAFCMINILYITVVYVMQIQRISFKIPCVLPSTGASVIEIQPIGTVFVIFFGFILLLQFVGMIFHRYETFMHIVSTTPITCGTTHLNDQSDEIQHAIATARDLQKLTPDDNVSIASNITINTIVDETDNIKDRLKERRPTTMLKLVKEEEKQKEQIGTLSLAFAKRFLAVKRQVDITNDDLNIEEHLKNIPKEKYSKRRQSLYFLKNRPDLLLKPDLEKRLTLHVEHKDYDAAIKLRQRLDEENKKHGSLTNLEIQGDFPEQV